MGNKLEERGFEKLVGRLRLLRSMFVFNPLYTPKLYINLSSCQFRLVSGRELRPLLPELRVSKPEQSLSILSTP
jgi:hypothetical protein